MISALWSTLAPLLVRAELRDADGSRGLNVKITIHQPTGDLVAVSCHAF
jgi:hypothetical protein